MIAKLDENILQLFYCILFIEPWTERADAHLQLFRKWGKLWAFYKYWLGSGRDDLPWAR